MNCPRHPSKRVISSCKGCGTGFCIECVRETDQTTLCPDCYRRKASGAKRGTSSPTERAVVAPQRARTAEAAPLRETEGTSDARRPEAASTKPTPVGEEGLAAEEEALEEPDFLAQGPDEDFSQLAAKRTIPRWRSRRKGPWREGIRHEPSRGEVQAAPAEGAALRAEEAEEAGRPAVSGRETAERAPLAPPPETSDDQLLKDVVSALLSPGAEDTGRMAAARPAKEERPAVAATARKTGQKPRVAEDAKGRAEAEIRAAAEAVPPGEAARVIPLPARKRFRARPRREREERAERWAFLSQPRASEYTLLAPSWWRAAIFVALMILLGSALWSIPNAYLVPKDTEYGIHSLLIGIVLGLCFWWKVGKKHSTKLAVQASLTTFFALSVGEFFHWFLIVMKNSALRTIVFDLISFRFIWENGAEIMRHTLDAMFPSAFLWVVVLPALVAFFIGFGMPPIPEVFFQLGRAIRE